MEGGRPRTQIGHFCPVRCVGRRFEAWFFEGESSESLPVSGARQLPAVLPAARGVQGKRVWQGALAPCANMLDSFCALRKAGPVLLGVHGLNVACVKQCALGVNTQPCAGVVRKVRAATLWAAVL